MYVATFRCHGLVKKMAFIRINRFNVERLCSVPNLYFATCRHCQAAWPCRADWRYGATQCSSYSTQPMYAHPICIDPMVLLPNSADQIYRGGSFRVPEHAELELWFQCVKKYQYVFRQVN